MHSKSHSTLRETTGVVWAITTLQHADTRNSAHTAVVASEGYTHATKALLTLLDNYVFMSMLGTYGYPSCSLVMANHFFQMKWKRGKPYNKP